MAADTTGLGAFGAALRAERKRTEESQADIAQALGVTGSAVGNWERGEDEPERTSVFALEEHFGLAPGTLSRHLGYDPPNGTAPPSRQDRLDAVEARLMRIEELLETLLARRQQ